MLLESLAKFVCVCIDIHLSVFYTIAHYLSDPNHIFIVLSFEVGRVCVCVGWGGVRGYNARVM